MILVYMYLASIPLCFIFMLILTIEDIREDIIYRQDKPGNITYGEILKRVMICFIPIFNSGFVVYQCIGLISLIYDLLLQFFNKPIVKQKC